LASRRLCGPRRGDLVRPPQLERALSHSSLILATPQTHVAGVCISAVVPDVSKRSFTIYLTTAVQATVKIAWFVVG